MPINASLLVVAGRGPGSCLFAKLFDVSDAAVLINQILQKKVVYASPRLDLTPLVIERFDNEYLRAGGAASIKLANKSAN